MHADSDDASGADADGADGEGRSTVEDGAPTSGDENSASGNGKSASGNGKSAASAGKSASTDPRSGDVAGAATRAEGDATGLIPVEESVLERALAGEIDRPSPGADDAPRLSVVVVTRNEEDRISACLSSILEVCGAVSSYEVILVDSNSTDRTVERASEFPVTILQIPDDEFSTASAGRFVGTRVASGEAILFVDGDMVLESGWLPRAMAWLEDGDVAGVDGLLATGKESDPAAGADKSSPSPDANGEVREVDAVRGVALYSAESLRSVGGFDPFLVSLEDIHLGFELTAAGYRLVRLPTVAATHPAADPYPELLRRWREGYTSGTGRTLWRSVSSPRLLVKHVRRLRYQFGLLGWLATGVLASRRRSTTVGWLALGALAFGIVVRERGLTGAATFTVQKLVQSVGTTVGFVTDRPPAESFPVGDVEVIARASESGAGAAKADPPEAGGQ